MSTRKKGSNNQRNDNNPADTGHQMPPQAERDALGQPGSDAWPMRPGSRADKQARRGLPEDKDIRQMAEQYLDQQRRLWPTLTGTPAVPNPDEPVIRQMVDGFKIQFLQQRLMDLTGHLPSHAPWSALGAAYLRYSCDNSDPRSLADQLHLQLQRAAKESIFIPWLRIFADASVTGTTRHRTGYNLAKQAMKQQNANAVAILFIDEIGRASRDAIEALRLGQMLAGLDKRMIGVSDGFDSQGTMAKMQLHMFAMMSEWFVDQLRYKVRRGMAGAARRGTSTGKPPVGIRLVPLRDHQGNAVVAADGQTTMIYAIDPDTFPHVQRAFEMFATEHKSLSEVAAYFNRIQADGRTGWASSTIRLMLSNYKYVGIVIYNQTSYSMDPETHRCKTKQNPRSEWIIRRNRQLQQDGLPWKLWKAAQRRLEQVRAANPRNPNKPSLAHLYPTTMVSGLIFCPSCGREMTLIRSAGRYQQLGCPNGNGRLHGCTFRGSRSVRILEQALVRYVQQHILTDDVVDDLIQRANQFLAEQDNRPRVDISPMRDQIKKLQQDKGRLHKFILKHQTEFDMSDYLRQEQDLKQQIRQLRQDIKQAESANQAPPPPITAADVQRRLEDLRKLLLTDTRQSAILLRQLFGKLTVRAVTVPGKARPIWQLEGQAGVIPVLAKAQTLTGSDYPDSCTWEYLTTRNWIICQSACIPVVYRCRAEQIADDVVKLIKAGHWIDDLAKRLGTDSKTIIRAWQLVHPGEDHLAYRTQGNKPAKSPVPLPVKLMDQVAALRHDQGLSIDQIAKRLGVTRTTAGRAHMRWHKQHPAWSSPIEV